MSMKAFLSSWRSQKVYPRLQVDQNSDFEIPRPQKHENQISKSYIFKNRSFMKNAPKLKETASGDPFRGQNRSAEAELYSRSNLQRV